MRHVSDSFLLAMAEASASLMGLFLVGVLFYMETGLRRLDRARDVFADYLRAGIRITMIVFAFPIGLSLTLVALEPIWSTVLFALLSLILIASNVESASRIWAAWRVTGSIALLVNEVVTSVMAVTLLVVPWVLGGLHPSREDLSWAILLAFAAGFLSIIATVMSAFDIARRGEVGARTSVRSSK